MAFVMGMNMARQLIRRESRKEASSSDCAKDLPSVNHYDSYEPKSD